MNTVNGHLYTRPQKNLYYMFFDDSSVNYQPILMKVCKDIFVSRDDYREIFTKKILYSLD